MRCNDTETQRTQNSGLQSYKCKLEGSKVGINEHPVNKAIRLLSGTSCPTLRYTAITQMVHPMPALCKPSKRKGMTGGVGQARQLTLRSSSCICGNWLWTSGLRRRLPMCPGLMAAAVGTNMENLLQKGGGDTQEEGREGQYSGDREPFAQAHSTPMKGWFNHPLHSQPSWL